MTASRASQVHVETTAYYHCISRCVRRAYLCGSDDHSGKNFDHRKAWLVERLKKLSSIFAIDVAAFAVLSNHFHVVLRVDKERAESWDEDEVVRRFGKLFSGSKAQLEGLSKKARDERVALWRARLWDLSWMMRGLNEYIARRANNEDGCAGRFWEGRFKSQALLDERGLLTCMAYVDLNPVRAGVARSLEASDFTSIQERLEAAAERAPSGRGSRRAPGLAPFTDQAPSSRARLPMLFADYVELLEWTGRAVRPGRRTLRGAPPALLRQLNIDTDAWLRLMSAGGLRNLAMLGTAERVQVEVERRGQSYANGQRIARELFGHAA
jgi:putative transposase